MFRTARDLHRLASSLESHAISFQWTQFSPRLTVYGQGGVESVPEFREFILQAGEGKRCVGRWNEEGYHQCLGQFPVSSYHQCPACAKSFIPQLRCVFEPRCDGTLCKEAQFCKREHKVYVAFFGPRPKVGMTSTRRLLTRTIEQGADAYAVVATLPNRFLARDLEKRLGTELRLRQNYRHDEVLPGLAGVRKKGIEAAYSSLKDAILENSGHECAGLTHLDGYPSYGKVDSVPVLAETSAIHAGDVVLAKGKYLIYRNESGALSALDMNDLVARRVRAEFTPASCS